MLNELSSRLKSDELVDLILGRLVSNCDLPSVARAISSSSGSSSIVMKERLRSRKLCCPLSDPDAGNPES